MIAVILMVTFAGLVAAQNYAVPGEVNLERVVRRAFPSYGGGAKFPQLLTEGFYPIGWSRDGKFAYYTEPVDEACGCYYAQLVIQDLRTDKVLWEFKYSQDDTTDEKGNMSGPGDIRKLWAKNRKLFSEKLAHSGIIAGRSTMLGKTFTSGRSSFTAKASITTGKNPEEDWGRVNIFNISLSSPNLGSKSVYNADYTKEEYWSMLDAGLVGVIKSPYENRVAIVGIEVMRGYEGPPHTANVRIAGADLVSGFGKK